MSSEEEARCETGQSESINNTKVTNKTPFEERLILVRDEIKKRINSQPDKEKDYYRARLWIRWIKQNILTPKRHISGPINCDLYPWRTANESTEVTPT